MFRRGVAFSVELPTGPAHNTEPLFHLLGRVARCLSLQAVGTVLVVQSTEQIKKSYVKKA